MQKYFIFVLSLILSGCAATKLTETDEQQIKNVTIVSVLPETTALQKIGLTVFNNERAEMDMHGQINTTIVSTANLRLMRSRPNWVVKDVPYDRTELIKKFNSPGMVLSSRVEKIQKDLADLAQKNGLDAILVFAPVRYDSIPGEGAGVMFRTLSLNSISRGFAHGNITLSIVSHHGTILAAANTGFKLTAKPIDTEAYEIKYSLRENLRPEVTEKLQADIRDVLTQNVNVRLSELGL